MNNIYQRLRLTICIKVIRRALVLALLWISFQSVQAQLSLTNGTPSVTINFSNTMPTTVGTNPSTAFAATGFSPNPVIAGRLNSNAWSMTAPPLIPNCWSDGNLAFGGTQGTPTDFGRGATALAVNTGGIYAYTGAPHSAANPVLMFQPGGSDFTPGQLTLRMRNDGSSIINQIAVSYNIYLRNDLDRSQSLNLSYSLDDVTYTTIPALDYATPAALDALGFVVVAGSPSRSTSITGIGIAPTQFFYIRWTSEDISGSGARDEIGLDDIIITATYPGVCTPPTTNATLNAFTNVLSTQMDVNFTRGNGTGGLLIVASPIALSQNPISGIPYTANANYGTGAAIGNGFVVYNSNAVLPAPGGTGGFTLTGLTPGTSYTLTLFEYQVSVPCYTITGVSGSQSTTGSSTTLATDAFRSRANGLWSAAGTWESFTGGVWINSDRSPTSAASTITIRAGHTVDINSSVSMDEVVIEGTGLVTLSNSGVINLNDGATANDIDIQNGGTLRVQTTANYLTTFVYTGSPRINVATGGTITIGSGGSSPGYSPLGFTPNFVIWNNASIFEWNTSEPFTTSGTISYFPNAVAGVIPIFRLSRTVSLIPGASTPTVWNGRLELNANLTLRLGGEKTFRDGIIGPGDLTQSDDCGAFNITGPTALLGGTGTITLGNVGSFFIRNGSVTTLTSNKIVNTNLAGRTFRVGDGISGALYCDAFILSGTATFALASGSTLRLGSPQGITAAGSTGNIQLFPRTFSTIAPYPHFIYNGNANQVTGIAMPTQISSLTIANTGGAGNNTVTVTNFNTASPILTLTSGLIAIGTGQTFTINTAGSVVATAGNFATGTTAGTLNFQNGGSFSGTSSPYNVYTSAGLNFGAGTVLIQNGGTFRINTGGFVNANGPFYADLSTLEYNTGFNFGCGNEWINGVATSLQRGAPHHVTASTAGTIINFGGAGSARTARGNLNLAAGTGLILGTSIGGDLNVGGNWTRAATATFTHNARMVSFNGAATQTVTVTGGGTETFGYLQVNKTAGTTLFLAIAPNATNIGVNGNPGATLATNTFLFSSGNIDLNQNTFTFNPWSNGFNNNVQITGVAGNFDRNITSTGGTGIFSVFNNTASLSTPTIARASMNPANRAYLIFGPTVTVTIGGVVGGSCGLNFGTNTTFYISTINGILQLNSNGFVNINPPNYGAASTLIYNAGGPYDRNPEWGATATQPGYPNHVIVQNNTNLVLNTVDNGNADRYMSGNLTIGNGSSLSLCLLPNTFGNKLTVSGNLIMNGSLTLPANAVGADLYLAGHWNRSATGVFTPNDRAVFLNGATNATVTASGGETFAYVYVTKNAAANTVSLVDDINITKEFGVTQGIFQLANRNTTLKSDLNATASMGKFGATGSLDYNGTGRFIVERYIPTATGVLPNHQKSWQFLAVPVDSTGTLQTIRQAWQENNAPLGNTTPGYGTIITNNTGSTAGDGFDVIGGVAASMKTYVPNATNGTWAGIPNTINTRLYNKKGYMLFVRGNRAVTGVNDLPLPTTLRTRGKIFEPANLPPSSTVSSGQFESVGNPYASAIDFSNEAGVVKIGGVQRVFYIWDPKLGGTFGYGAYQTLTKGAGTDYTVSPGGGSYGIAGTVHNFIESGQAFLVRATGSAGTISFNENAKVAGSRLVTRLMAPGAVKQLRTQLYINENGLTLTDGVLNEFSRQYSLNIDGLDAVKLSNLSENLGIVQKGEILAVERRSEVRSRDTIHLSLGQVKIRNYQFEFSATNLARPGLSAFLVDKWLSSRSPINLGDTTRVNFSVNNNPGSYAADRFMIVFKEAPKTLPRSLEEIHRTETAVPIAVYPNPVIDGVVGIQFGNVANGNYQVTLFNQNGQAVSSQALVVTGAGYERTNLGKGLAAGIYHCEIVAENGTRFAEKLVIQ